MKELSIEEKAKAYDEALIKARNIVNSINVGLIGKDSFEAVFPELVEPEDEQIRGAIIHFISHTPTVPKGVINKKTMLTWLEKQREQKPTELSNICEFSLKTWIDIVAYVLKEHNGIGNYLDDPEVRDTAKKLHKKYKFDCANEEWDRVYRRGLDAGINYGKTEALRVQTPVGWSEEDEKFINRSISYLKEYGSSDSEVKRRSAQSCINWLEALRDDKLNDSSIVKYKVGDKVRFLSCGEVFTILKVENRRYIFADGGGDTSVYEELIPVKESKDTLTRDKVKCGDYVVDKDGTVIKVHDIDNFGHVCYYYFANKMTEDGGKIQDNRAFMKYYGIIQDCRMATQSEIDFLEKWVAHKKYIWVGYNVSPDDEEED